VANSGPAHCDRAPDRQAGFDAMQRRAPGMIGLLIGRKGARFDVTGGVDTGGVDTGGIDTGGVDTGGVDTGGVDRTGRARTANVLNTF
jgi:hypothetical protein